ncbi:trans-aconitate 2-methyltransferase [Actinomadura parmotrematis]|uniref:Trans-aconitate 2-methyltransferase n=1 Tax=Actinomadura parmotrematis TaxID=2864039 RepID=A0ABS7FNQ7_9ACTN|nr:trans-aconitate 2-methyltransferase [Actinomadura parmotrematis]MBW8481635.1 trans-aconitate 2-methyltransferase [Actinomadura parmotrematis]
MSRQPRAVWDPAQYGAYAAERGRPFAELLGRVRVPAARRIADLGCGSGELTATLAERWPDAGIDALDASPEMIDAARAHATPRLRFAVGDVTAWEPGGRYDVIVCNAVLQWVPGHLDLLPRWLAALNPGGRLAFQVPGNFAAPSHALLRELCAAPRWRAALDGAVRSDPVLDAPGYLDALARDGWAVDAWETTYTQVLQGDDPVLEWVKGTALRPVLTALGPADAAEFLTAYAALLREAYPAAPYGTVFPFRRVFVVAGPP